MPRATWAPDPSLRETPHAAVRHAPFPAFCSACGGRVKDPQHKAVKK